MQRQERQGHIQQASEEESEEKSSIECSVHGQDGSSSRECGQRQGIFWGKADSAQMEVAIKIFKTSILVFKDREKYVAGVRSWLP